MVLTVAKLDKFINHALDGEQGSPLSSREIVNQVGEWFVTENSWRFNRRRAKLNLRPEVSVGAATFDPSTLYVKSIRSFTSYEHTPGDILAFESEFDAWPNTTPGEFVIRDRIDADTIELESDPTRNMIHYSEDFNPSVNGSYWTETFTLSYTTDTPDTLDPFGGTNADIIMDTSVPDVSVLSLQFTEAGDGLVHGRAYCFSVYTKQIPLDQQGTIIGLSHAGGSKSTSVTFNTNVGQVTGSTALNGVEASHGFETLANGWYRLWITMVYDQLDTTTIELQLIPVSTGGVTGSRYYFGASFEEVAASDIGPSEYERRDSNLYGSTTAFSAKIPNHTIELPDDIADVTAIATSGRTLPAFRWVGQQEMAEHRQSRRFFESYGLRGAVVAYAPSDGTSGVKYRLEIDRNSSTDSTETLELRYISGWKRVTEDDEHLPLPADGWLDALFTQAVIAWAQGLDEEDDATLYARLGDLTSSKMWTRAVGRDAGMQRDMGPSRGSDVRPRHATARNVFHEISTDADD